MAPASIAPAARASSTPASARPRTPPARLSCSSPPFAIVARTNGATWLTFDGGWLIVVSNRPARAALQAYAKRWAIECLFGDAKTRGLNIEDTRLTCPRKLHLLMAVVALALAWAAATAAALLGSRAPARKAHEYQAKSWCRTRLDHLRHAFRIEAPSHRTLCAAFKQTRVA